MVIRKLEIEFYILSPKMSNRLFYEGIVKCLYLDVIKFFVDKKGMPLYT